MAFFKESNKKSVIENKRKLIEKAMKKKLEGQGGASSVESNSKEKVTVSSSTKTHKETSKQLETTIKKLKNQLSKATPLVNELKQTVKKKNDVINRYFVESESLKAELSKVASECKKLKNENSILVDKYSELKSENSQLKEALDEDSLHKTIADLKATNRRLLQSNNELKNTNKNLTIENQNFRQINEDSLAIRINEVENENLQLNTELKHVQSNYEQLKNFNDIDMLIKMLSAHLSVENIESFKKIFPLYKKVSSIYEKQRSNLISSPGSVYEKMTNSAKFKLKENKEKIYGYIVERFGELKFIGLNNQIYDFNLVSQELCLNTPAKAFVDDKGAVHVYKYYEVEANKGSEHDLVVSVSSDESIQATLGSDSVKNLSFLLPSDEVVLIVGSRNLTKYRNVLMKTSAEILTHDPFSESEAQLVAKYNRSSITVICTSHISHSVLDLVNIEDEKVELIQRDNADTILVRVRYAAMRLGILNNQ